MIKILNSYELLLSKKIIITINKEELPINFSFVNLKHLLGLQYINDNDYIKKISPQSLPREIRKGNLNYDRLSESKNFNKIEERLENFYYFTNFLLSSNYISFNSYKVFNPNTRMKFDYLLTHTCIKDKDKNMYLGLSKTDDGDLKPVTFFVKKRETEKMSLIFNINIKGK